MGLILLLLLAGLIVTLALRQYYPAEPEAVYFVPGNLPQVALSFETLWSSSGLERILEILAEEDVRATFFISGTWLKQNPEAAKLILKKGHELGNHTLSHKNLLYLSEKEIAAEIKGFNDLALELLEYRPRLFRPPLGLYNGLILKQAGLYRCQTVLWSIESYDTISRSGGEIAERVMQRMHGGAIISFRVGAPLLPEILPVILAELVKQGYAPVTVTSLLKAGRL